MCSFQITLDGLTTFRNDLGTRSFLSVLVKEGKQAVCDLVRAVDRAFAFLGLQTFYKVSLLSTLQLPQFDQLQCHSIHHATHELSGHCEKSLLNMQDPQPHLSLAWALGDCTQTLQHAIDEFSLSEAQQGTAASGLVWQHQVCIGCAALSDSRLTEVTKCHAEPIHCSHVRRHRRSCAP